MKATTMATIGAAFLAGAICLSARPVLARGVTANGTPLDQRIGFFAGYFGHSLKHPGFQLGAEHYLAATKNFEAMAAGSFQLYRDPGVENGYSLHLRIGQRLTADFGLSFETQFGVGVQLTDYSTTVFTYPTDQLVIEDGHEVRTAFSPHVLFGTGYDFRRKLSWPVRLYVRAGLTWLYPDLNLAFQTTPVVEAGLAFIPRL